ncbi:phage major tail protein, TP901-1 family [Streptococcus sp. zg-JUN1979]|uniref:phage major tail protein, TP901-1 family n=1 Tax=Streptococcus sp. zg-JUN1979 TaxID=3391450 RepID=UPI0039A76694
MVTTIDGKDLLAFFRLLKNRTTEDAARIRFMTEITISMEKETDSTPTVDGNVTSVADGENTMELKSIAYREDDPNTINLWEEMHQWYLDNETVEFWAVDIKSGVLNKETQKEEFQVHYFQGHFTEFELSSSAEGKVELSYSFAIDGKGVWRHKDVLTDAQMQSVKAASYAYHTLAQETTV